MATSAKHSSSSGIFGKRPLYIPSLAEIITGDYARMKSNGGLDGYHVLEPTSAKNYVAGYLGKLSSVTAKALGTSVKDYTGASSPSPDTIIKASGLGSSASAPVGISSGAGSSDYLGNGVSVNYRDAELAQHYGMDASTAYQEALSNTGYQRSVKDMQAAGLNPAVLFGAGAGNPAFGVNYVSQGAAGNSSGYSVGASSAKSNAFFYKLFGNAGTLIGAAIKGPYGAFSGRALGQAIGNLVDDITK